MAEVKQKEDSTRLEARLEAGLEDRLEDRAERQLPAERLEQLRARVYRPAPLDQYTFLQGLFIRSASFILFLLIYLISLTIKWEIKDQRSRRGNIDANQPLIYVFWHNRILPATWFFRNMAIVVMTSQSYDGEIIARLIQRFGYGASRGSATRGGSRSLREMASCLAGKMDVAFTIDGPKGPIYVAKPGAVQLAKLTNCPLLPVCQTTSKFFEVKSWDRFRIPKPFSKGLIAFEDPIYVTRDSSQEEVEKRQAELQAALDKLHLESEQWRNRINGL